MGIQYLIHFKQSYYLRYCLDWNELKLVQSWLVMLEHVLILSAYLFSIGIYNLITGRNIVWALMCLELILNVVNINLIN